MDLPHKGWHHEPPATGTSHEANLARIKFFRNQVYGHVTTTGVDVPTSNSLWKEISAVLVSLGLSQPEIDRLKPERCGEEDYLDALRDWAESERDLKSRIDDVHRIVTEIRETQHDTDQEEKIRKKLARVDTQQDVRDYGKRYLEGTRESFFAEINSWLDDESSPNRVLVLSGNAGMGKSVIAAEMCKECKKPADWQEAIFVTMTEHATGIPR